MIEILHILFKPIIYLSDVNRVDEYRHKGMRRKLAEELQEMGISNEAVLEAIKTIPRHFFIDSTFEKHAFFLFVSTPRNKPRLVSFGGPQFEYSRTGKVQE